MKKYKIYVHINKVNGKIYIGQTSQRLNHRWDNGNGYASCVVFYRAIKKYGWDNFDHIEIISGLSKEEADIIEIELIKKYKSNTPNNGYNISSGESGSPKIKYKNIYKYDLNGDYIEKIDDITFFDKNIQPAIRQCCEGKIHYAYGFQYKLFYRDKIDPIPTKRDVHVKHPVIQMDLFNNIINTFKSIVEASENTGISVSSISKCCRGKTKTGGGYLWNYLN